jgi:hypothetical protein
MGGAKGYRVDPLLPRESNRGLLKSLQKRALVYVQELGDQMHGLKRPILLRAYPNICNFFDKYIYQGQRLDKTNNISICKSFKTKL